MNETYDTCNFTGEALMSSLRNSCVTMSSLRVNVDTADVLFDARGHGWILSYELPA